MIIFWQNNQGTPGRDPEEGCDTFAPAASQLANTHVNIHGPSIPTVTLGIEALNASFNGLRGATGAGQQQHPFVARVAGYNGWNV